MIAYMILDLHSQKTQGKVQVCDNYAFEFLMIMHINILNRFSQANYKLFPLHVHI